MFKIGEHVIYNKDVCKIVDIKHNNSNDNNYYILIPVFDESLKIKVPAINKNNIEKKRFAVLFILIQLYVGWLFHIF